jgi:hypothetical protein
MVEHIDNQSCNLGESKDGQWIDEAILAKHVKLCERHMLYKCYTQLIRKICMLITS